MKSSNSTGVLGLKRSVDLNMNSNVKKEDDLKGSEGTKARRSTKSSKSDNGDSSMKGSEKVDGLTFTSEDDVCYEPGDCVYVDSQRPDVPYFICSIKEFRMSKRDSLVVTVRWYYRPSEIPESVYQLLVQDRNTENGSNDHILEDEFVKERELFISDATDVYPAAALRGKCKVRPFVEISENLKEYIAKEDCFFYLLGYNPETRRLANTKGEIRVGASHQAILPECTTFVHDENDSSFETSREKLVWSPILDDYDLMMYLRASRSMAQYAGMCSGGSPEDGFRAMSQDATTSNALNLLHESSYDSAKALQALVRKPYPKELRKKWTDDDIKKFVKGLRQFGKNFFKIHKELLNHKKTSELVEYYYIWKKSHSALSSRPHRRRRHNVLRRKVYTRSSRSISSEFVDLTSCSEDDDESDESTERDLSLYCCRHCYTSDSRSWHHGGYNKVILCTDCRKYFKKYGKLPPIEDERKPPSHMFKAEFKDLAEDDCWNNGKLLRSRRNMPPAVQTTLRSGRNKMSSPVDSVNTPRQSPTPSAGRRPTRIVKPASPSDGSSSSTGSSMNKDKNRKNKSKKNKLKRSHDQSSECGSTTTKRKKGQESDEEAQEDVSDTSSATGGRDSVAPDFDARSECSHTTNNDDNLSTRSNSPLVLPIMEALPAKFKRVGPGDENRSCARTDVVFVHPEKPKVKEIPKPSAETSTISTVTKSEASESASTSSTSREPIPVARQSPKGTPATVTSHYESSLRSMMTGEGGISMYPPNAPAILAPGVSIPGYHMQEGAIDYRMLQYMYPSGVVPERGDNVAKFAEGFEQWYAPYRSMGQVQGGHYVPYQLLGRGAVEQNALASRSPQAHEAMMKNAAASGRSMVLDPVTGLPVPLGNHHSHSHMHTHFHIHPHEQQQMQLQAAAAAAAASANMDRAAYLQAQAQAHAAQTHPGIAAWRNQQLMWQHPELMQLHASGMSPAEEHAHGGAIHGLGSTSLDRQLQQQLLLSQHSKYHQQHSLQQQLMQQEESYLRHLRHHQDMQLKQRLEEAASGSDPYNVFRKEQHRNLQSPSQLDNVVKKNLETGSSSYVSPGKKPPVTIDLSND